VGPELEIVKRAADAAGFKLLPRRWVVERTLAWLNRNRRVAKDFETSIASAKVWVCTRRSLPFRLDKMYRQWAACEPLFGLDACSSGVQTRSK
jgi:hypothetical protein